MQKKKGISLITLIITIIVMIILVAVVMISTSDTNIVNKANEAVDKHNEAQNKVIDIVEEVGAKVDSIMGGKRETMLYSGSLVGQEGAIILPKLLNDTSKQYILYVSSSLYTGKVLLNVYGITVDGYDTFTGAALVDAETSYPIEARYLLYAGNGTVEMQEFWSTVNIDYQYDYENEQAILRYNSESLGSELTINKITCIDRTYTKFAKLLTQLNKNKLIKADDMIDIMKYCVNVETLGYNYVNEEIASALEGTEDLPQFDEALELQTIKDIMSNRTQDLADIEYSVTDQIKFAMFFATMMTELPINDVYTRINLFEENEWLNEYFYRMVGNTIIPFTILFSDEILKDLNDDGKLSTTYLQDAANNNAYVLLTPSGNAGITVRAYADAFAVLFPIVEENENMDNLTYMEQLKLEELLYLSMLEGTSDQRQTIPALLWYLTYFAYTNNSMDTMYELMYNNGITINMAGLKMGWNSIITEYYKHQLASQGWYFAQNATPKYNVNADRNAIQRQGVSGILNELSAYIIETQAQYDN